MVTYAKTSSKMVNPRDIAGNAEEEELIPSTHISFKHRPRQQDGDTHIQCFDKLCIFLSEKVFSMPHDQVSVHIVLVTTAAVPQGAEGTLKQSTQAHHQQFSQTVEILLFVIKVSRRNLIQTWPSSGLH